MAVVLRALVPLLPLAALASCGGGNAASQLAQAPAFQPPGQTKCGVEKSQSKPLIVEWPSADRGELEARAHGHGLVVVRYEGCEMRILDSCTVPVKYGYAPITRKKDHVAIRNDDDLYANIPLGAAGLEAKLEKSGELDVDMTLVGRWEAERAAVRSEELQGACDGATHVISALTVGAFTFTAGSSATVGAGATVLGAGGGAQSSAARVTLNADGDESACLSSTADDKMPPAQCGALIRIEVAELAPPSCPDGAKWNGFACFPVAANGTPVTVRYKDTLDPSLIPIGFSATVDGVKIAEKTSGLAKGTIIPVFDQPLASVTRDRSRQGDRSGDHTIALTWLFRTPKGHYTVKVDATHAVTAVTGKALHVDVLLEPKDGKSFLEHVQTDFVDEVEMEEAHFIGQTHVSLTTDAMTPDEALP
jgi:hypothetical protein